MGVVKKSLQTRQRSEDSSGASPESGVGSQSVLSVTVLVSMAGYTAADLLGAAVLLVDDVGLTTS